jgi:hypothetical protein
LPLAGRGDGTGVGELSAFALRRPAVPLTVMIHRPLTRRRGLREVKVAGYELPSESYTVVEVDWV